VFNHLIEDQMKRIGTTLLIALTGGLVAIGGYKLIENKNQQNLSFEERQDLHYANRPISEITASTGNLDFTQASALVAPGVVHIKTTYAARSAARTMPQGQELDMLEEFFGIPRSQRSQPRQAVPMQSTGSGVIISNDGYIVTNNHVVEDAEKIEVSLPDRRSYEAKIIGRDPNTDIALIKIEEKNLPFVKLGNSDDVRIGEWVLAVGYPLGLESTVTAGIVSATGRSTGIIGRELQQRQLQERGYNGNPTEPMINTAIESFIQTDAVINKGNSGGALVNAQGELIGVNSNIMSPSGYYAGYGFAVPVNLVKKIADDFVKFGAVKRGLIGINFRELSPEIAKELGINEIQGLYVNDAIEGGAAQKAGLRKGDVITKLDGRTLYASSDLQERIYRLRPGDKVNLTYKRDGKERDVTITLQEESKESQTASTLKSGTTLYNKLGGGFTPTTAEKKTELGVESGVTVTQVFRGGLLNNLNITSGMVITHINDVEVNNINEIEKALEKSRQNMVKITVVPRKNSVMTMSTPIE
jgi:serine protease Do